MFNSNTDKNSMHENNYSSAAELNNNNLGSRFGLNIAIPNFEQHQTSFHNQHSANSFHQASAANASLRSLTSNVVRILSSYFIELVNHLHSILFTIRSLPTTTTCHMKCNHTDKMSSLATASRVISFRKPSTPWTLSKMRFWPCRLLEIAFRITISACREWHPARDCLRTHLSTSMSVRINSVPNISSSCSKCTPACSNSSRCTPISASNRILLLPSRVWRARIVFELLRASLIKTETPILSIPLV
jgi:hypothetical protein